ncbi:MAG: hypothetical protein QNJ97_10185 [Myxococcota bacterium]|nr:hypothetical protein [Myxococcota bacterium]
MYRILFAIACLAFLLTNTGPAWAACHHDAHCKGQGTCVDGVCTDAASALNTSSWFVGGYGLIGMNLGIHSWGKWRLTDETSDQLLDKGRLSGGLRGGFTLAGYKVLRHGMFQIGGAVSFTRGRERGWRRTLRNGNKEETTLTQFSFAVSFKIGKQIRQCLFLGGGLDFGPLVHFTQSWEALRNAETDITSDADIGLKLYPNVYLETMLLNKGTFKLGLSISGGVVFVPGVADIESSLSQRKETQIYATPVLSVGLMLGA